MIFPGIGHENVEWAPISRRDAACRVSGRVQSQGGASGDGASPVSAASAPCFFRAVSLQALISKEGTIQELQILSGPRILAAAAREAVKQWHFKPYLQNGQPVETQAKITVNFTISTN